MRKLQVLGEKWEWDTLDLSFADIGSPLQHIENLRNGIFKPIVTMRGKHRRANYINMLEKYRRQVKLVLFPKV